MKIVHIITSLNDGGAEHTLYKICKYDKFNEHVVISLKKGGKYKFLLKKLGVSVYSVDLKLFSFLKFFYIVKLIGTSEPDIVQTWLVHGDLIGGLAARLCGIKNIVWNVRYSNFELGKAKLITIILIKILAKLSFLLPKLIVVVSNSAKKTCKEIGYCKKKLRLITNGYDLSILDNNKYNKSKFRKVIKIKNKIPLIGNVARYDLKKDHINLLKAISLVRIRNKDFYCILVGSGINKNNKNLMKEIRKLNLRNNIKLLGPTSNIPKIMSSLDLYIQSSSYGEGFPNVVSEAMACRTPSVVTDVGDAAYIVGNTGWVVPPKNPLKLSKSIEKALNEMGTKNWKKRCDRSRSRIKQNFDIEKMLKSFNKVWTEVLVKTI